MRLAVLILPLLAGCAAAPNNGPDPGHLILLSALIIPPESATLRLQYATPSPAMRYGNMTRSAYSKSTRSATRRKT